MNPHEWKTDFWKTYNLIYRKVIAYATNENYSRVLKDIFGLFDRSAYAHIILRGSTNVVGTAIINLTNAVSEEEEKVLLANCDLVVTTSPYLANTLILAGKKVLFLGEQEHTDAFSLFYRIREILEYGKYKVPVVPQIPALEQSESFVVPSPIGVDVIGVPPKIEEPTPLILNHPAKVGIVMPLYNQGKYVSQTIESFLGQKFTDWTLYVVDDGSTDDSFSVVSKFTDPRIMRIRYGYNKGTAWALNVGFSLAKEEYLTWVSSDNLYYPDFLQKLVSVLDEKKGKGNEYVFANFDYIDKDGKLIRRCDSWFKMSDKKSLTRSYELGMCFLFTRKLKDRCGDYDLRILEDYDMAVKMAKYTDFFFIEDSLGSFRVHDSQISANKNSCVIREWEIKKQAIESNEDFVSIIVPTYNRVKNLRNSLYSLLIQYCPCRCEILVIDDGSTDNTKALVEAYQKQFPGIIRYIYHQKNLGFSNPAIAHNIGLIYARGNIIIQSGADIVHKKGTIHLLYYSLLRENCFLSAKVNQISELDVEKLSLSGPEDFWAGINKYSVSYPIAFEMGDYVNATPFCSIYRKEWVYKIGLYDENFAMGGGEDCDFVYRMQTLVKTKWDLHAVVSHQKHPKFGGKKRDEISYLKNLEMVENSRRHLPNRLTKRILFMGSFNVFDTPGFLWDSLRQHFMRLGHDCYFYDAVPKPKNDIERQSLLKNVSRYWNSGKTEEYFRKVLADFNPEIIIAGINPAYNLLAKMKNTNAMKVMWYGDMSEPEVLSKYYGLFDMMFVTNKSQVSVYKKVLGCDVYPVAFGVSDTAHVRGNLDKKYDVGFAGDYVEKYISKYIYKKRSDLLTKIKTQYNLEVIDKQPEKTFAFYDQCKIVISDRCDYAIENDIEEYVSNRFFNIVGTGAFCLVRYFPGLEHWGQNGVHFVWYKTDEECLALIEEYLKEDEKRNRIAYDGYLYFHEKHNWLDKVKYISGILEGQYCNSLGKKVKRKLANQKNIFMCGEKDCAGVMYDFKQLLQGSRYNLSYYAENKSYCGYGDEGVTKNQLQSCLDKADIIFHHSGIRDGALTKKYMDDSYDLGINWDKYKDKTIIFLNGSANLRSFKDNYDKRFKGFRGVVATTPDLCEMFDAEFTPVPLIISGPRTDERKYDKIICSQFPTDLAIKNTKEFREVGEILQGDFSNFKYEVIQSMTNTQVINHKATVSHIGFDHMGGYFGVNTIESGWVGQAVIASLFPAYMSYIRKFCGAKDLPFLNVLDKEELEGVLRELIVDLSLMKEAGLNSKKWFETYWNKDLHIANLERIMGV